jgi:putative spermidine/putrescine transport system permease protein
VDCLEAEEFKTHTRLGTRLNYETTGLSSLLRKTGRGIGRWTPTRYTKQFEALDPKWEDRRSGWH